jgi:hypothetical protein
MPAVSNGMSVLTKGRGESRLWRHRDGRPGRAAERDALSDTACDPIPMAEATLNASQRRRIAGAPQDCALYSCGCGFQFQAAVSTSVGCPHCGDTQAW